MSGTAAETRGIVDMWGPAAPLTPFSSTINIVPIFTLVEGVTELEAHNAIQSAEFWVARRLAETTIAITPEDIETFELFKVDSSLPRVVYIPTVRLFQFSRLVQLLGNIRHVQLLVSTTSTLLLSHS